MGELRTTIHRSSLEARISSGIAGNMLLHGSGVPAIGLGNTGDFYIDTTSYLFYGPKTGGGWGTGATLSNPSGLIEIPFVSSVVSHDSSTYLRIASREIDLSLWPSTSGALARKIRFYAAVQKTSGATSLDVRLYDVTHGVAITGATLNSTSTSTDEINSGILTTGSSSGNLRSDAPAIYEAQVRMNGGGGSDQVFVTNARLVVTYE